MTGGDEKHKSFLGLSPFRLATIGLSLCLEKLLTFSMGRERERNVGESAPCFTKFRHNGKVNLSTRQDDILSLYRIPCGHHGYSGHILSVGYFLVTFVSSLGNFQC